MKEIVQFEAEDGKVFTEAEACVAYEARLPFVRLFDQVQTCIAADADFRDKIEALGTQLARDRRERGELRRERKRKGDNGPVETPPDPPPYCDAPGESQTPAHHDPFDVEATGADDGDA